MMRGEKHNGGGSSRKGFTAEEREYLASLPAVESVTDTSIHYTEQFRRACMEHYVAGESPTAIFRAAGLAPELVGYKRIERCFARWRRMGEVRESHQQGVSELAGEYRELREELSLLSTKVLALEGLVELAGARTNAVVRKCRRFELIDRLREEHPDLLVSQACAALGVSESGYYRWRGSR